MVRSGRPASAPSAAAHPSAGKRAKSETPGKNQTAMDITPGLNPLAKIRFMEVMIGAQRQFVLFTGPGNSPVVAMQDDGSAKAGSGARRLVLSKRASNRGVMKPRRGKRTDRAGYALVLFLMMVFGLMGLAALVIDLGFARLAQRQMQTAVDSAALEGLRFRDDIPAIGIRPAIQLMMRLWPLAGHVPKALTPSDCNSRLGSTKRAAGQPARWWPTCLTTTLIRPTGIQAITVPGRWWISPAGSVRRNSPRHKPCRLASRRFTNQTCGRHPGLELNSGNAQEGDMVAGTYGTNLAYDQRSPRPRRTRMQTTIAATFRTRQTRHFLSACAERRFQTFRAAWTTPLASVPAARRFPSFWSWHDDVSASGSAAYSPRRDGIEVRATAIAAAGPATGLGQTSYEVGRAKAAGPPYQGTDANNNPVNIPGINAVCSITVECMEFHARGRPPGFSVVQRFR